MRKLLIFVIIFSCVLINSSFAQKKHLRKARKYELKGEYVKATISYQLYLENNNTDISIYKKLADLSCKLNDFDSAEMYCEEIINNNMADPETYFIYINVLRRNAKYDKSLEVFKTFYSTFPNQVYKYFRSNTLPSKNNFYVNSQKIHIVDFDFNSNNSEFSPYISNNEIYFTSYDNGNNRIEPETKVEKFIDEYITTFRPNYKICKLTADTFSMKYREVPFEKLFGSNYHEGIVSVSPSGKIMYLSAAHKSEKTTFGHSIVGFDIYEARLNNNKWKITQKLFDITGKSFAHPCINKFSNMLYFASDMDGGYGGTDLYVSYLRNGYWSEPENLGPEINTPGNELYPFIDENNTLYFTSDGHPGLGGLDIFVISVVDEKISVFNVGAPINSRFDDYGITCYRNPTAGLFSSNRPGGLGEHDIYKFSSEQTLNLLASKKNGSSMLGFMTLKGEVKDAFSNKLIDDAKITLHDEHGNYSDYNTSSINGKFTFIIPIDGEYRMTFSAKGYKSHSNVLTSGKKFFTIKAEPEFIFPNINFDYNSSNITEKGKETLNKIVDCLFQYPKSSISIKGYADIISEEKDNKKLSQERTSSIEKYLENKGILKNRIITKSLGTKNPIVTLDNGKALEETEDAQSVNRRVEITIIHPSSDTTKN